MSQDAGSSPSTPVLGVHFMHATESNTAPPSPAKPPSPTPSEQQIISSLTEEIRERKLLKTDNKFEGSVRSCERVVPSRAETRLE